MTIDEWLRRLEESGWLSEVAPAHAVRIRVAAKAYESNPAAAFESLAMSGLDAEMADEPDLQGLIDVYVEASGGLLKPEDLNVKANADNTMARISFSASDKQLAKKMDLQEDLLSDLHSFFDRVLKLLGHEQRFRFLPTKDQTASLVCISPATYKRARHLGLIPKQEDWESEV
jgi:hypothetical protein